jgi:hypothetical protein
VPTGTISLWTSGIVGQLILEIYGIQLDRSLLSRFIEFVGRLIYDINHPIFSIVDGNPAHKAKKVKRFSETVKDQLRVFYL